jgi:hypothetical protein
MAEPQKEEGQLMRDWYEMRDRHEVGRLVRSTGGEWMVRPPQRCGNGHRLTPGHVLVGSMVCACGERRHLTWLCDCGDTSYGPPLGLDCSVLNGPAAVR